MTDGEGPEVVDAAQLVPDTADPQVVRAPYPPGPRGSVRLDTVGELLAYPDGTVVIWHSWDGWEYQRQAGVLDTWDEVREIRPVTLRTVEYNTRLDEVDPPVWVVTFDDQTVDHGSADAG